MIEYRVKPITRHIVTRYERSDNCGSVSEKGAYDNYETAYAVAYALCKTEHDASGDRLESMNFIYPEPSTIA